MGSQKVRSVEPSILNPGTTFNCQPLLTSLEVPNSGVEDFRVVRLSRGILFKGYCRSFLLFAGPVSAFVYGFLDRM